MNNYNDLDNPGNVSPRPQAAPEGSHFSRTLVKLRPDSLYIPLSSFTVSK